MPVHHRRGAPHSTTTRKVVERAVQPVVLLSAAEIHRRNQHDCVVLDTITIAITTTTHHTAVLALWFQVFSSAALQVGAVPSASLAQAQPKDGAVGAKRCFVQAIGSEPCWTCHSQHAGLAGPHDVPKVGGL